VTTVNPDIRVVPAGELAVSAAAELAAELARVVSLRGRCRLALAGGSTPAPVYERLAVSPRVPWASVDVFFGDERAVPADDAASNYAMAKRTLLDRAKLPAGNVHRIHGELAPAEAARAYAGVLGDEPLDVVLLGMGGDGHTASLFPDTPQLDAAELVRATHSPVAPHDRISLGMAAINRARAVYFLVAGAGKATRLAEVRDQIAAAAPVLPAAHVQPQNGRLIWLIDSDAASSL